MGQGMNEEDNPTLSFALIARLILLLLGELAAISWLFWFDWRLALAIVALHMNAPKVTD
jgi:hypothetical protein